ncbi:MAG TPA: rhodanese-like domain-containing protein [Anaerolineales bacterium]|nr:rhodanese-like domain-containing protein [Anaerolineales bacterium]
MMIRMMRWFLLVAMAALAACQSQSGTPAGARVEVEGGSYTNVNPAQLDEMLEDKDFVFVNTHIPYEGEIAHTDAFIAYDQVEQSIDQLPADPGAMVVLYCRSGRMSAIAAETLVRLGYRNVWNLEGGMVAWEAAGLPLER